MKQFVRLMLISGLSLMAGLCVLISNAAAQSACTNDNSVFPFDDFIMGEIAESQPINNGYQILLVSGGDEHTIPVTRAAPYFQATEDFIKASQTASKNDSEQPLGAFLVRHNALCAFTRVQPLEARIVEAKRQGGRYTAVAVDTQTNDRLTVYISPENNMYRNGEALLRSWRGKTLGLVLDLQNEILRAVVY